MGFSRATLRFTLRVYFIVIYLPLLFFAPRAMHAPMSFHLCAEKPLGSAFRGELYISHAEGSCLNYTRLGFFSLRHNRKYTQFGLVVIRTAHYHQVSISYSFRLYSPVASRQNTNCKQLNIKKLKGVSFSFASTEIEI